MCSSFILHVAVLAVALAAGRSSVGNQLHPGPLFAAGRVLYQVQPWDEDRKQEKETGCGDRVSVDARGSIKPSMNQTVASPPELRTEGGAMLVSDTNMV